MQWAIYYVHPDTGVRYPCVSSGSQQFGRPDEDPALFASRENAVKAIYGLAKDHRSRVQYYAEMYPNETPALRIPYFLETNGRVDLPYEPDFKNWHVLPVILTPDIGHEDAGNDVITDKQKRALGIA